MREMGMDMAVVEFGWYSFEDEKCGYALNWLPVTMESLNKPDK